MPPDVQSLPLHVYPDWHVTHVPEAQKLLPVVTVVSPVPTDNVHPPFVVEHVVPPDWTSIFVVAKLVEYDIPSHPKQ